MQAIITKYHPPSNVSGARISARCARGRISIPYPLELPRDMRHEAAARALIQRFIEEDLKQRGEPRESNPWNRSFISGDLPDGTGEVFVFLPRNHENRGDDE